MHLWREPDYVEDEEWLREFISGAGWKFAKTMPQSPHWYTLRRDNTQSDFDRAVMAIRKHGFSSRYGGVDYTILVVDEYKYWTMGWPLHSAACPATGRGADCHSANCTYVLNRTFYQPPW